MKAIRIGAAFVVIAATLAMAGGASATQPQPVTITVETTIDGFEDPFVSTGGLVCGAGAVSNAGGHFVGWQSGTHAQILLVKYFVCPDGSFDVLLRVTIDFATGDTVGTWSVRGGTGAYASLHGAGSLTGDSMGETILDTYSGGMHID